MKKLFIILMISILAVSTVSHAQDTLPSELGKELQNSEKLRAVIESGDPRFIIVDVRSEYQYKSGHIPSAINIPSGVTSNMENPPQKDKYIIIYCNTGVDSQFAAEKMLEDGYKYVLDWGGICGHWPYDLEKSDQQPAKPAPPPSLEEGC